MKFFEIGKEENPDVVIETGFDATRSNPSMAYEDKVEVELIFFIVVFPTTNFGCVPQLESR